ncbi:multicopper oxidase-domain-containing protein [Dendryphion nanum]|uniref:Multicopper oxidase-domain-containing protein n=1 Tax=Dendryphion nanum TaxID=256645 RepID=A0A9P9IGZ4_9PLEO|nr:multicopper oxidase-domain-containing protein [Dendryphion nanum]
MLRLWVLIACASICFAKTVTYNFNIGWVSAAPDGYRRPVIGINGQWPIPIIEANEGDTIVVHTTNSLGNQSTSLHFHGQYQIGSCAYDGAIGAAQCPIEPGDSFTYTFIARPAGTHWYHSHEKGQYPDGLRGLMIIHDPKWERSLNVEKQIYLTMSDWWHTQQAYLVKDYMSPDNRNGDLPSPDAILVNDSIKAPSIDFNAGKRYFVRVANVGGLACGQFHIEGHTLSVVEVDGEKVKPHDANTIFICAGQRYGFIVKGKWAQISSTSYIIRVTTDMFTRNIPSDEQLAVIGKVVYRFLGYSLDVISDLLTFQWRPQAVLDDFSLQPLDNEPLLAPVDQTIRLGVNQQYYEGIGSRIAQGVQPWVAPKVPTLYTALSTGKAAWNETTYGPGVDPYIIRSNSIVQIYMVNSQRFPHPMHLHGHHFQLVARGSGTWNNQENLLPKFPVKRDTVVIPANGYIVLRFRADNPGVWFFHCHIDFHSVGGMVSTFIEAPDLIQKQLSIPASGTSLCSKGGKCTRGNCACQQGELSESDAIQKCNTIFNTHSGEFGAMVY